MAHCEPPPSLRHLALRPDARTPHSTSSNLTTLADRGHFLKSSSASLGIYKVQEACGKIGGSSLRESGEIGRSGEGGFEQRAHFWRLGDDGGSRRELGGVAERLGEALENVGAPRCIVYARGLGDALDERG